MTSPITDGLRFCVAAVLPGYSTHRQPLGGSGAGQPCRADVRGDPAWDGRGPRLAATQPSQQWAVYYQSRGVAARSEIPVPKPPTPSARSRGTIASGDGSASCMSRVF